MICSYCDHAANERTFLAWARTGLSAIALGIVVEKGPLLALAIGNTSPQTFAQHGRDYLGICGPVLVGTGIAVLFGAGFRFVRTALRIDDPNTHTAGVVRFASLLFSRRQRERSDQTATDGDRVRT